MVPSKGLMETIMEIRAVLGESYPTVIREVGWRMGERWGQSIKNEIDSMECLFEKAAAYLQKDLQICELVEVEYDEKRQNFQLYFGEMNERKNYVCFWGSVDRLEEKNETPDCPIAHFILGAIHANKEKLKAVYSSLDRIEMPGPAGVCSHYIHVEYKSSLKVSKAELGVTQKVTG